MGISGLSQYLNEYAAVANKCQQAIDSKVCYIDYTSVLVSTTANISKRHAKNDSNQCLADIHNMCEEIIQTCVHNLVDQLEHNKYFIKYIIVFDYKCVSNFSSHFYLNDELLSEYIHTLPFQKDYTDLIPMIPKTLDIHTTPVDVLKESVRNLYELRIHRMISDYQNLYVLKMDESSPDYIQLVDSLISTGYNRYFVLRGAKNATRRERNIKNMCKAIHSNRTLDNSLHTKLDNVNVRLYETLNDTAAFTSTLHNFQHSISYQLIINLIPLIVQRIKAELQSKAIETNVEFIGCENESDFVIRKHIKLYNQLNCPTVYSNDSDLFMLLCDVDCYIRLKQNNLNVRLKPNLFWRWLTGSSYVNFRNISTFCCLLGNDYTQFKFKKYLMTDVKQLFKNKYLYDSVYTSSLKLYHKYKTNDILYFLLVLEMYAQADLIENNIHYLDNHLDSQLDIYKQIELKYRNIFTEDYWCSVSNESESCV